MSTRWPVTLEHRRPGGALVRLRPLRRGDRREWEALREANRAWLAPWETTMPGPSVELPYGALVRSLDRGARRGHHRPWAIEADGALVGQAQLQQIMWGSLRQAVAGYWVDHRAAGQGLAPLALAMVADHALLEMGLHRVEVNVRPENAASLRVVEKLGLRCEGLRRGLIHVAGEWADHLSFAVVAEEVVGRPLVRRLEET